MKLRAKADPFCPALSESGPVSSRSAGDRPKGRIASFVRGEDGAVAMIAAFAIPALLGFTGLALEYGHLLHVRAEAQRSADLASHAGAVAYAKTGDTAAMVRAAQGVARLNGFLDAEIVVTLESSSTAAGGQAVRATITAPRPLYLPQLLGGDPSVDVKASALAGALGGQAACVQALDPDGSGITLSGGARLSAAACGVASNSTVAAPCGTGIVTETLSYVTGTDPLANGCNTIVAPDGGATRVVRQPTSDPLKDSAVITQASAQMSATSMLSPPDDVIVPAGTDMDFGWSRSTTAAQAEDAGCTASFDSGPAAWTFSCPGKSVVDLGRVTIGGGLDLYFNPGGAQDVVYNISGGIRNNGDTMRFAGGIYNVANGIVTGGGSTTEFGAGTYRIGRAADKCTGAHYSICNTSRLSFEGPSDFVLTSGVRNGGGSTMTLGTGAGNSFRFGPSSGDTAISLGGGSMTYMGDATGGVFEVSGWIDGVGGGSCLQIPAADLHEIDGSIDVSGGVLFGAGLYSVSGYVHIGGNGGGSVTCQGQTLSVEAIDATFLIAAGDAAASHGNCRNRAFCVSAGYNDVQITAPSSGVFAGIAVVGPLDASRAMGAAFTSGASGAIVSGAFYFPNGPIVLSGGAGASGGNPGCLQLIGSEITMSGGSSVASDCNLPQANSTGRVVILG